LKLTVSCPDCGKVFRNLKSELAGKKARCSCGKLVRLGAKKSSASETSATVTDESENASRKSEPGLPTVAPERSPSNKKKPARKKRRGRTIEIPITVSVSSPGTEKPLFNDTYGDLDDILAGAGDSAPLKVPEPQEPATAASDESTSIKAPSASAVPSQVGVIAGLLSATLAVWFGTLIATSKFALIDWPLIRNLSNPLQNLFYVSFGEAEVTTTFNAVFLLLSWILWLASLALIAFGIGQFLNTFVQLLFRRPFINRIDGLIGTCAATILFLMIAIIFTQITFSNAEYRRLEGYNLPFSTEQEKLANVIQLQATEGDRSDSFTNGMLFGSAVPFSIFALTMLRLFTKAPPTNDE
jgi:hypothetical protein